MASKEDCRKFWLCKEKEEGSRVLEVIWVVVRMRLVMRIVMMICKEEEKGARGDLDDDDYEDHDDDLQGGGGGAQ